MNPPTDNGADQLKQRLNQIPPQRPNQGGLTVPSRPQQEYEDIDDSAFSFGNERPQRVPVTPPPRPNPTVTPLPPVPPAPSEPAPAPVTPAEAMPPASVPPAPTLAPQPQVSEPDLPLAPAPQPLPPALQPAEAPTPTPAPTPASTPSSAPTNPLVAQPAAATPPPAPTGATGLPPLPTSAVAYEPPVKHIATDIVERIDETPQQSSKDIEELIDHQHRLRRLKGFASFLMFVAGVVIAAFLINQFVFQSYYVDGTSMTPTLQNNDRLIIDKVEKSWTNMFGKTYIPARGQIVVLDSSIVGINGNQEQLIKRVIGLPGDTLIIKDGTVTVKNKDHPDGFDVNKSLGLNLQPTFVDSPQEITIPDGQVFVMGDNRVENGSYDSRAFGPIDANKIVGRLWVRILPFDKAKVF